MTKGELTQKVQAAIDRRGEDPVPLGETIRRQPELGFKEFKTAKLVAQTFERMGLAPRTGLAIAQRLLADRCLDRVVDDGPIAGLIERLDRRGTGADRQRAAWSRAATPQEFARFLAEATVCERLESHPVRAADAGIS